MPSVLMGSSTDGATLTLTSTDFHNGRAAADAISTDGLQYGWRYPDSRAATIPMYSGRHYTDVTATEMAAASIMAGPLLSAAQGHGMVLLPALQARD